MDHSYHTRAGKWNLKDHSYFHIGSKRPKVLFKKSETLQEAKGYLDDDQEHDKDHTYGRPWWELQKQQDKVRVVKRKKNLILEHNYIRPESLGKQNKDDVTADSKGQRNKVKKKKKRRKVKVSEVKVAAEQVVPDVVDAPVIHLRHRLAGRASARAKAERRLTRAAMRRTQPLDHQYS